MNFMIRWAPNGLWGTLRPTPLQGTLLFWALHYFTFFQLISHVAIALNRYTVIVHPMAHLRVSLVYMKRLLTFFRVAQSVALHVK
jgi:hypothetical protein